MILENDEGEITADGLLMFFMAREILLVSGAACPFEEAGSRDVHSLIFPII